MNPEHVEKTLDQLEELLESEAVKLRKENQRLRQQLATLQEESSRYCHRTVPDLGLPLPRLQITVEPRGFQDDRPWSHVAFRYDLVYRHYSSPDDATDALAVPLGWTTSNRGLPANPPIVEGRNIEMPHRDAADMCHDAVKLGLPMYVVLPLGADPYEPEGYYVNKLREGLTPNERYNADRVEAAFKVEL